MPYSNKQMLRDANGDLIPQYWDVAEQEFKPLTGRDGANDVRLNGSIVEVKIATAVYVTAGATTAITDKSIDISKYVKVGLRAMRTDVEAGGTTENIDFFMFPFNANLSAMSEYNIKIPNVNEIETTRNYRVHTELVDVISPRAVFRLRNGSQSDHSYDVWLVGKTR